MSQGEKLERRGNTAYYNIKLYLHEEVLQNYPKHYISHLAFSYIYPPRNVSEIKGKILVENKQADTHPQHTKKIKKSNNLCFYVYYDWRATQTKKSSRQQAFPFSPR